MAREGAKPGAAGKAGSGKGARAADAPGGSAAAGSAAARDAGAGAQGAAGAAAEPCVPGSRVAASTPGAPLRAFPGVLRRARGGAAAARERQALRPRAGRRAHGRAPGARLRRGRAARPVWRRFCTTGTRATTTPAYAPARARWARTWTRGWPSTCRACSTAPRRPARSDARIPASPARCSSPSSGTPRARPTWGTWTWCSTWPTRWRRVARSGAWRSCAGASGARVWEELFVDVLGYWTILIIEAGKPLHPDTVGVWNAYVMKRQKPLRAWRGTRVSESMESKDTVEETAPEAPAQEAGAAERGQAAAERAADGTQEAGRRGASSLAGAGGVVARLRAHRRQGGRREEGHRHHGAGGARPHIGDGLLRHRDGGEPPSGGGHRGRGGGTRAQGGACEAPAPRGHRGRHVGASGLRQLRRARVPAGNPRVLPPGGALERRSRHRLGKGSGPCGTWSIPTALPSCWGRSNLPPRPRVPAAWGRGHAARLQSPGVPPLGVARAVGPSGRFRTARMRGLRGRRPPR